MNHFQDFSAIEAQDASAAVMPEVDWPSVTMELSELLSERQAGEGKAPSKRALNNTAYRIFKLLQWLIQSPLSVEAMNQKFCAEPRIGKPVSTDSIWLYINTLKALGCNIRRPSPRNNFQYVMHSHPFGLSLSEHQLEALSQAKAFAQQRFSRKEMQALDGLLKKIVGYSVCDNPQALIEQLFARSRSFDYGELSHHVEALEAAIEQQGLVQLTYLSPKYGEEQFQFLPVALFYDQGVVYLRGERPEFEHPSTLRVDRLVRVSAATDPVVRDHLLGRQALKTEVRLHILAPSPGAFDGFGLSENQGVYQEQLRWVEPLTEDSETLPYYEVVLQVREFFFVKQRLLLCGLPFRIFGPERLRDDLRQTLESMRQFYQAPTGEDQNHG